MDVVDLAPHMRPACHLVHGRDAVVSRLVQLVEAGIAVGVQEAAKALQLGLWMNALAVGRVAVQHGRRRRTGVGDARRAGRLSVGPGGSCRHPG